MSHVPKVDCLITGMETDFLKICFSCPSRSLGLEVSSKNEVLTIMPVQNLIHADWEPRFKAFVDPGITILMGVWIVHIAPTV